MKNYTSDTFIFDIKNGLKLDFHEILLQPCCNSFPLSKEEMGFTNSEIQKLKSKKVIVNTEGITLLPYLPGLKRKAATE